MENVYNETLQKQYMEETDDVSDWDFNECSFVDHKVHNIKLSCM